MLPYKAVLFDLDGTLLDTLDDLADAVNYALSRFSYPLRTREEVRAFVGNGVRLLIVRALPEGEGDARVDEVLAVFKTYYADHARVKTAPYSGISSLLRRLFDAGVRVGVVSNKFDAAVRELSAFYFGDLVPLAIGEQAGIPKKPAPDALLAAMEALGVSRGETVYIGDSEVDAETAARAGLPLIAVLWGFRDRAQLAAAGATCFAADAEELSLLLLGE